MKQLGDIFSFFWSLSSGDPRWGPEKPPGGSGQPPAGGGLQLQRRQQGQVLRDNVQGHGAIRTAAQVLQKVLEGQDAPELGEDNPGRKEPPDNAGVEQGLLRGGGGGDQRAGEKEKEKNMFVSK